MKNKGKKSISLLISLLIVALSVITVAAYLFINFGSLSNNFKVAEDDNPYYSVTDGKYSVKVPNKGYAVYVRAAIVVNWKTGDGTKILGDVPLSGVDYNLTLNTTNWFKAPDGFYYHKAMVTPPADGDGYTQTLIEKFETVTNSVMYEGETYFLNIDIVSQTIQALGTTDVGDIPAVEDAWGIKVNADKLLIDPTT